MHKEKTQETQEKLHQMGGRSEAEIFQNGDRGGSLANDIS
jgi:hypothetical protein